MHHQLQCQSCKVPAKQVQALPDLPCLSCLLAVLMLLQGMRKPAAGAYQAAVSHLQLPPDQLIFVDDRQPNVDAAAAQGLKAIKFSGCAKALETDLKQLGLEF